MKTNIICNSCGVGMYTVKLSDSLVSRWGSKYLYACLNMQCPVHMNIVGCSKDESEGVGSFSKDGNTSRTITHVPGTWNICMPGKEHYQYPGIIGELNHTFFIVHQKQIEIDKKLTSISNKKLPDENDINFSLMSFLDSLLSFDLRNKALRIVIKSLKDNSISYKNDKSIAELIALNLSEREFYLFKEDLETLARTIKDRQYVRCFHCGEIVNFIKHPSGCPYCGGDFSFNDSERLNDKQASRIPFSD